MISFPFFNQSFDKKRLKNLLLWYLANKGEAETLSKVEKLQQLGFQFAMKGGISLGVDDLKVPTTKGTLLSTALEETKTSESQNVIGNITAVEQFQHYIDTWHRTSENLKSHVVANFRNNFALNPVYMMAFSGARGNLSQVRQLVGMRGLMADPQGQIVEFPIQSNFREGLTVTEYMISCYGARKGLVDTALRTADAGYLTRRLVDVSHHVVVKYATCGTYQGVLIKESDRISINQRELRFVGRVLAKSVPSIAVRNTEIDSIKATALYDTYKKTGIFIRSPLSCNAPIGICQLCYGWSLCFKKLVSIGEAVGIMAAQSIGEPGTQLTMRTFHTGGVFSGDVMNELRSPNAGVVYFPKPLLGLLIRTPHGKIALCVKTPGTLVIKHFLSDEPNLGSNLPSQSTEKESALLSKFYPTTTYNIGINTILFVRMQENVYRHQLLAQLPNIMQHETITQQSTQTIFSDFSGEIFMAPFHNKKLGILRILAAHTIKHNDQNLRSLSQIEEVKPFSNQVYLKENIWSPKNKKPCTNKFQLKFPIYLSQNLTNNKKLLKFQGRINFIPGSHRFCSSLPSFNQKLYSSVKRNTSFNNFKKSSFNQTRSQSYYPWFVYKSSIKKTSKHEYSFDKPNQSQQKKNSFNFHKHLITKRTLLPIKFNTNYSLTNIKKIIASRHQFLSSISKQTKFFYITKLTTNSKYHSSNNIVTNKTIIDILLGQKKVEDFKFPILSRTNSFSSNQKINEQISLKHSFITKPISDNLFNVSNKVLFLKNFEKHICILWKKSLIQKILQVKSVDIQCKFCSVLPKKELVDLLKEFNLNPSSVLWNSSPTEIKEVSPNTFNFNEKKTKIGTKLHIQFNINCRFTTRPYPNSHQNSIQRDLIQVLHKVKYIPEKKTNILNNTTPNKNIVHVQKAMSFDEPNTVKFQSVIPVTPQTLIDESFGEIFPKYSFHPLIYSNPYSQNKNIDYQKNFNTPSTPMLLTNSDRITLFCTSMQNCKYILGDFIEIGNTLASGVGSPSCGQIISKSKNQITLRKLKNILYYAGGKSHIENRQMVEKGTAVVTLPYQSIVTGDIVQGIPKIEQLFEGRGETLQKFICNVWDRCVDKFSLARAVRESFKEIALFVIAAIQEVYLSQGVHIADQHLEVIVRQMTNKAMILDSGNTSLFPGEYVNLTTIECVNYTTYGQMAIYRPVLLGITAASLNSDSFLSAASFQETTRVLTRDSFRGKTDFLRGLKERVMLGDVIRAGTGNITLTKHLISNKKL